MPPVENFLLTDDDKRFFLPLRIINQDFLTKKNRVWMKISIRNGLQAEKGV